MRFRLTRARLVLGFLLVGLIWLVSIVAAISAKSEKVSYTWEPSALKPAGVEYRRLYQEKTGMYWLDRVRECRGNAVQRAREIMKSPVGWFAGKSEEEVLKRLEYVCEAPTPVGSEEEFMRVLKANPPTIERSTEYNFDLAQFAKVGLLPLAFLAGVLAIALTYVPKRP